MNTNLAKNKYTQEDSDSDSLENIIQGLQHIGRLELYKVYSSFFMKIMDYVVAWPLWYWIEIHVLLKYLDISHNYDTDYPC